MTPIAFRGASAAWLGALLASVSTSALAQTATPVTPPTDPREARIQVLEDEVRQLAAEVQDLKNSQAAQIQTLEGVEKRPLPAASATIANGKPAIVSADGNFSANFHAIMQFDVAQYLQDSPLAATKDFRRDGPALGASASNVDLAHARHLKDGDDFRRARIGVDGTVYRDWDYRLIFDFGGTGTENTGQLYETWVQYSGLKPFHFRVGAFSPSIGLDDQASTNGMPFLERSAVEDLARGLAAGDTRTAGEVWAAGDHWLASAAISGRVVGVVNTGTAAAVPQTFSDQLAFVGRLAGTPFHGDDWLVHLGVHGSYVIRPPDTSGPTAAGPTALTSSAISLSNTPELRVDATKFVNTGNIPARHADTVGAEFAVQKQNFLLQAEYENFGVDRSDGQSSPNFNGFYVSGSWIITGDRRQYNAATAAFDAPVVLHPFQFNGSGWGAIELALRYSELDLNYHPGAPGTLQTGSSIRGGDEQNFTAGLNWFPNSVVKFMFDYAHVRIDRLNPAGTASAASTIWLAPAGAQIGQSYDAFEMRSQFSF
jgi:phosphate-selective porin OprO/OprP